MGMRRRVITCAPSALIAIVALGAGCAELPEVARNECGNGVHEPLIGEECDGVAGCGAAATANQCGWVCEGGVACPTGYLCGADDRCREPSETFAHAIVQPMGSSGTSTADMDGDRIADLLGYDSRGLVIRYGDETGSMAAHVRVGTPLSLTRSCTPDVDGMSGRDLVLPIVGLGLALFVGDGARGQVPVAQSAVTLPNGPTCEAIAVGSIDADQDGAAQLVLVQGGSGVGFLDAPGACDTDPLFDCVVGPPGAVASTGIVAARLGYDEGDGVHPGEQFSIAVVGHDEVSVWGQQLDVLRPKRLGRWTLSREIGAGGRVAFLNIDNDGCPDLVVDTGTTLEIAHSNSFLHPDDPTIVVCDGLLPAVDDQPHPDGAVIGTGDLDNNGLGDFVYKFPYEGVTVVAAYIQDGLGGWTPVVLLASIEDPTAAAVLDFNHDGFVDLALTLAGTTTVDFYLNYAGQGYSRFPVDVGGATRAPIVGDFDGDLLEDLIVPTYNPVAPDSRDSVMVIYGDPSGRPETATFLGEFNKEATAARMRDRALEGVQDGVIVVSNQTASDATCLRSLAVLIGDTSRRVVSPFIVTYIDPATGLEAVRPLSLTDVSSADGVARVLTAGELTGPGGALSTVISVLGFENGDFTVDPAMQLEVSAAILPSSYFPDATWVAGDLGTDGVVEAIGLSSDKAGVVTLDGSVAATISDLDEELWDPPWIELLDLDRDGDLDLVGAGGSGLPVPVGDGPPPPASRLWIVANDGGELDFASPTVLAMPATTYCVDADVLHTGADAAPQLAVVCYFLVGEDYQVGVIIATYDPEQSVDEPIDLRVLPVDATPIGLEIDDFTGDGLEDIAVLTPTAVTLYRQCQLGEVGIGEGCIDPGPLP